MTRPACKRVNSTIMHLQGPDDQASVQKGKLDNKQLQGPVEQASVQTRRVNQHTCKV